MAEQHSLLNTTFPVMLPLMPELRLSRTEFDAYVKALLGPGVSTVRLAIRSEGERHSAESTQRDTKRARLTQTPVENTTRSPFMTALLREEATVPSCDDRDGKMLTENRDVAFKTSGEALVDLFYELEDVISVRRRTELLEKAWQADAEVTLRIIWNARSIHLGKSSRHTFYRAIGWLAQNHPLTLITNLPWLVRPIIQKKATKKGETDVEMVDAKDADSDFEVMDEHGVTDTVKPDGSRAELSEFDVKYGVAHGYWKDLLNILALAANGELRVDGKPRNVLNIEKPKGKKRDRDWREGRKASQTNERHDRVVEKLKSDKFYKALHLSVTRLFAEQLEVDLALLKDQNKKSMQQITLAAKWAPTHKGMHDQNTCIVTSIAEALYPFDQVCPAGTDATDRMTYLKYARIAYQSQTLSPLRKHLSVVERSITANEITKIKYDRVPSLAMQLYTPLFAKKDFDRFDKYIDSVAAGKSQISGATLLPSKMVNAVEAPSLNVITKNPAKMMAQKMHDIKARAADGQWNTLVRRIKDSGTLESSIAVCDVSGSMDHPKFPDQTCPMDSAIGLSLLLAEVTNPPFGGAMITFSATPKVVRVGGAQDKRSFADKVRYIRGSEWGGNTNFQAVFALLLNMARKNRLKQEDMVKQLFVFSDMHFDQARGREERWTTSFERIRESYREAGYALPKLIFWNLAGGRAGYGSTTLDGSGGQDAAPKPVVASEKGTVLVSGYSQGQMKMFLDNGSFDDPVDEQQEEEVEEYEGEDGEVVVEKKKQEKKDKDSMDMLRKAVGHEACRMLKVVD